VIGSLIFRIYKIIYATYGVLFARIALSVDTAEDMAIVNCGNACTGGVKIYYWGYIQKNSRIMQRVEKF